jgi:hypothetical protein
MERRRPSLAIASPLDDIKLVLLLFFHVPCHVGCLLARGTAGCCSSRGASWGEPARYHDRLLSGWIQPQTNAVEHDSTRLLRENKLSRTTRVATLAIATLD